MAFLNFNNKNPGANQAISALREGLSTEVCQVPGERRRIDRPLQTEQAPIQVEEYLTEGKSMKTTVCRVKR